MVWVDPSCEAMICSIYPHADDSREGTRATRSQGIADVWFLALGSGGLHGIAPPLEDGSMFRVRRTEDPRSGSTVFDVTLPVGLALASASAIAVVRNVALGGQRRERRDG